VTTPRDLDESRSAFGANLLLRAPAAFVAVTAILALALSAAVWLAIKLP
jgi:hypothetical protein